MTRIAPTLAAALLIAGCAQMPTETGLTPADRTALAGKTIVTVEEPAPETQGLNGGYRPPVVVGGGIGVALVTAAFTLAVSAVDNAISDVDALPRPTDSVATHAEAVTIERLMAQTGALAAPHPIFDASGRFTQTGEGRAAMVAAAQSAKTDGAVLNVRTVFRRYVSSGADLGLSTERFDFQAQMTATLVDVASGREIARAECFEFAPLGTMEEIQQRVAAAQKRYDLAVERRQETLSRLRMELSVEQDAAAQDALTEEIAAAEARALPSPTMIDGVVREIGRKCGQRFAIALLSPPNPS